MNEYYVSKEGNDNNRGTSWLEAWASVGVVPGRALPDSNIHVREGLYLEQLRYGSRQGGTPDGWHNWEADGDVLIHSVGRSALVLSGQGQSGFVRLTGMNFAAPSDKTYAAFLAQSDVELFDCILGPAGDDCAKGPGNTIAVDADGKTIDWNVMRLLLKRCTFFEWGSNGSAIDFTGCDDSEVTDFDCDGRGKSVIGAIMTKRDSRRNRFGPGRIYNFQGSHAIAIGGESTTTGFAPHHEATDCIFRDVKINNVQVSKYGAVLLFQSAKDCRFIGGEISRCHGDGHLVLPKSLDGQKPTAGCTVEGTAFRYSDTALGACWEPNVLEYIEPVVPAPPVEPVTPDEPTLTVTLEGRMGVAEEGLDIHAEHIAALKRQVDALDQSLADLNKPHGHDTPGTTSGPNKPVGGE